MVAVPARGRAAFASSPRISESMDTPRCNEVASKAGALRCVSRSRALLALLAVLLAPAAARPASEPVRTDHLDSRLVAQAAAAVPGQTLTLGLLLEHDPHWHT